jgi:hypothetical protein
MEVDHFLLSDWSPSGSLYASWLEEGNLSTQFQHGSFIPFFSSKIVVYAESIVSPF